MKRDQIMQGSGDGFTWADLRRAVLAGRHLMAGAAISAGLGVALCAGEYADRFADASQRNVLLTNIEIAPLPASLGAGVESRSYAAGVDPIAPAAPRTMSVERAKPQVAIEPLPVIKPLAKEEAAASDQAVRWTPPVVTTEDVLAAEKTIDDPAVVIASSSAAGGGRSGASGAGAQSQRAAPVAKVESRPAVEAKLPIVRSTSSASVAQNRITNVESVEAHVAIDAAAPVSVVNKPTDARSVIDAAPASNGGGMVLGYTHYLPQGATTDAEVAVRWDADTGAPIVTSVGDNKTGPTDLLPPGDGGRGGVIGRQPMVPTLLASGDLNFDSKIDLDDLAVIARSYGQTGVPTELGDLNSDGAVDFGDLVPFASMYQGGVAAVTFGDEYFQGDWMLAQDVALSAVPEPTSMLAIASVGLALSRRRRFA